MKYSEPFLLSSEGSDRATSYGFSNKSVTLNGRTHVVWLDSVAKVCGRTFDHTSGIWGPTLHLFDGLDNHTSPALVADSYADPHLHIAFGPHGFGWNNGQFHWAISDAPVPWRNGNGSTTSATARRIPRSCTCPRASTRWPIAGASGRRR